MKKTETEKAGERKAFSFSKSFVLALPGAALLFAAACQPNQTVLKDVPPPAPTPMETVEVKKTSFEQDLRDMQAADFDYILVFRRKDGGEFGSDDRRFLRENTPPETNRFVLTDEGKAFIAGSGFGFLPEQMEALRERFNVEDHSKPEIKANANKAANAPSNQRGADTNITVKTPANE